MHLLSFRLRSTEITVTREATPIGFAIDRSILGETFIHLPFISVAFIDQRPLR
ncbi:hypothetical protein [Yoonia vestfoldensis]|uniref:hypothetical protein n=1 Tax=Yoonia vestfoldensis TaxID=245188 RepID=UPI00036B4A08|nr:hypothetical protein [Yoonia vestfoldensis]